MASFNTDLLERKVEKSIKILKNKSCVSKLLIGLSGGKDSLVLCELVRMAGIRGELYFNMEFLPDFQIQKDLLAYAEKRFNIKHEDIIKIPSEHFLACWKTGVYSWQHKERDKSVKNISRTDIFRMLEKKYKGTVITGVKKCDSLQMQRMLDQNRGVAVYPLADWTLQDVFSFMQIRKIDIPPLTLKGCRGVGISHDSSILFIYEHYYDDFLKIEKVFPFVRAIVLKYEYYNLKKTLRVI